MVCNPDPPQEIVGRITVVSEIVTVESDDSADEDMLGNAPPGYELLPQGPTQGLSSDEEEVSDAEADENSTPNNTTHNEDIPSSLDTMKRRCSEVQEVDHLYSAPDLRPELTVDCDQVRAAMSGFTLPASAIPAWASNVPETQLAAMLTQQIHRLQGGRDSTN